MASIPFTSHIESLPSSVPFVGPEAQERQSGSEFLARIGANENVFGPSPVAIDAMIKASGDVWKYADPESFELRSALAAHHHIPMQNIVVGEGIDALLGYAVRLFVENSVRVVTSLGAYPTFNFQVAGYGGELITIPYSDDHEDWSSIANTAAEKSARVLYLANPDNPMGTSHVATDIQSLIEKIPEASMLFLDEAYIEFAGPEFAPPIDIENPQVIRFRTFSKAYGMAGARIGYAIGNVKVINAFDKIRNHFGLNRTAQIGALAALKDQQWLKSVVRKVQHSCEEISRIAGENGLLALPTAANFVTLDCGHDGEFARAVLGSLTDQRIFARMPGVPPLDRCIRVSAGTDDDLELFRNALPLALNHAQKNSSV